MKNQASKGFDILRIFNYLGGALIFFGIVYFINLNWSLLNDFTKIFATLGSAIAAYISGILLSFDKKFKPFSTAFFMISGLVLPIGLYVTFKICDLEALDIPTLNTLIIGICFGVYFLSVLKAPSTLFLLFTVIFSSGFYFALILLISAKSGYTNDNLMQYEWITLGISYILLGWYLDYDKKFQLTGPLYFFGGLYILAASLIFSNQSLWNSGVQSIYSYWKISAFIFILLSFILSVPLKSKSFLYLGAIFLVIYIISMSSKFLIVFGSFGWPLLLIVSGFLLILLGYCVYYLHKKISQL